MANQSDLLKPIESLEKSDVLESSSGFQDLRNTTSIRTRNAMKKESLPVLKFREEIIETVKNNPVTIITAETGAGKSTQVPQFLLEEGYNVVITQPRRLAARSVAMRVAEERNEVLGYTVGFRTATEKCSSPDTSLLFCTDGLQLVKELSGAGVKGKKTVLILDEVHEWNLNMETLVAWVKRQIENGQEFKVVLMSATLDSEKLSEFFNGVEGKNAPIIDVPGKLYPVEDFKVSSFEKINTILKMAEEGRNVLVFEPGKADIDETISLLKDAGVDAEIFPLHSKIEPNEQNQVFKAYGRPKIVVATNIAQTSITIPDIDAVVDSAKEKRVELINGVEGLYLKPISESDSIQRKGRAGRTKAGKYFLLTDNKYETRDKYPIPEVNRIRLDQMVLRLANMGIDAVDLDFFHQPDRETLMLAKKSLVLLGALDNDGKITKIGSIISKLPVSVSFGRMIVEAEKNGSLNDVVTISAIIEAGGLRDRTDNWKKLTKENSSDVLAELDLFNAAQSMNSREMMENGIFTKAFFRAKEIRRSIIDGLRRVNIYVNFEERAERQDVLKSVMSGMVDHLYKRVGKYYLNGETVSRNIDNKSVLETYPSWVVGCPIDIQIKNGRVINLINFVSEVDPLVFQEIAPQLCEIANSFSIGFDSESNTVVEQRKILFQGREIGQQVSLAVPTTDSVKYLIEKLLFDKSLVPELSAVIKENEEEYSKLAEYAKRANRYDLLINDNKKLIKIFEVLSSYNYVRVSDFVTLFENNLEVLDSMRVKVSDYVSAEEEVLSVEQNPDSIEIFGGKINFKYISVYSGFAVRVFIEDSVLKQISEEELKTILPKAHTSFAYFNATSGGFGEKDLNTLKIKVARSKVRDQVDEFLNMSVAIIPYGYESEIPALPEVKVFDEDGFVVLYPAYVYSFVKNWETGEYVYGLLVEWAYDKEEANIKNKRLFESRQNFLFENSITELNNAIYKLKRIIQSNYFAGLEDLWNRLVNLQDKFSYNGNMSSEIIEKSKNELKFLETEYEKLNLMHQKELEFEEERALKYDESASYGATSYSDQARYSSTYYNSVAEHSLGAFAEVFKEAVVERRGRGGRLKTPEKSCNENISNEPSQIVEMTDLMREEICQEIADLLGFINIVSSIENPGKKDPNLDKILKLKNKAKELKGDIHSFLKDFESLKDATKAKSKAVEFLRRTEAVLKEYSRIFGLNEKILSDYRNYLSKISEIAIEQEIEFTKEMLEKIRPLLFLMAQEKFNDDEDIFEKLEAIFIESL